MKRKKNTSGIDHHEILWSLIILAATEDYKLVISELNSEILSRIQKRAVENDQFELAAVIRDELESRNVNS